MLRFFLRCRWAHHDNHVLSFLSPLAVWNGSCSCAVGATKKQRIHSSASATRGCLGSAFLSRRHLHVSRTKVERVIVAARDSSQSTARYWVGGSIARPDGTCQTNGGRRRTR